MDRALVPSLTREGSHWLVAETGGATHCDCPPFNMGKTTGRPCKHMRLYETAKELMRRCGELHATGGDTLCGQCLVALLAVSARKVNRLYTLKSLIRKTLGRRRGSKTARP